MVTLLKIIAGLTTKLLRHKSIFDAVMRDAEISKLAADNSSVRARLKSDLHFLVTSVTEADNEKRFFANDDIVAAGARTTKIRQELKRDVDFLVTSALAPEMKDAFFNKEELIREAAERPAIKRGIGADLKFLVSCALSPKMKNDFFGNGDVVRTAAQFSAVRENIGADVQFLVSSALSPKMKNNFFGNGDVVRTAAQFSAVRENIGADVQFLVSSALSPKMKNNFFGNGNVVRTAAQFSAVRENIGADVQFLVSSALSPKMKNNFFGNGDVVRTAAQFSAVKEAVRAAPINQAEAVKFLKRDWPKKQRQLGGFLHLCEIRNRITEFYGDAAVAECLLSTEPPETGFANDIELANFIIDCLCEDDCFQLREQKIQFVDRHALWTLINEIILCEEYYFESDNSTPFIIDAGANFGLSSIYFKQLYPEATVLSFEPVPYLHELIEQNIANNDIKDVTVLKKALSESAGECKLFVSEEYSMAASLTDRRRKFKDNLHEITVETAPLSAYIDREVDFLKLDIEGSEGAVLLELGDKLTQVKQMCVEWHITNADGAVRLDDVLALLSKHGFIYQIGKAGNFARKTRHRPMTHVHENGTLNFWATRP